MKMLMPFLHVVGVLLLFVGLGVEWAAIGALRRSPALRKAERWARRSLRCQIAAAAVILASGAAMAARLDAFHFAWVNVSLVALVLIAALAGIASRRRASVAIRIALALGVFYLMVAKPEIVESLIVMTLALGLGAVAATRTRPAIRVSSGDVPAGASVRS